jgi:hypothetical protein
MMKTKLKAASAAVLIAGVLTGCANVPAKNTPEAATYGTYPNDYKALIDAYQQTTLKERRGAISEWTNVGMDASRKRSCVRLSRVPDSQYEKQLHRRCWQPAH